jgi:hypothetical protein
MEAVHALKDRERSLKFKTPQGHLRFRTGGIPIVEHHCPSCGAIWISGKGFITEPIIDCVQFMEQGAISANSTR